MLSGAREQADEAVTLAERLLALQTTYRERLTRARVSATAYALLDELFANPVVTARRAQELLGVTNPTARAAIAALEREGVLREITSRRWGRVFRADEIYDVVRGGE